MTPAPPALHRTPDEAWKALREGNARFVSGDMAHPSQDAARRSLLADGQAPFTVIFGCSDSRAAMEIVFDLGLGDAFVVRNAGHVIDTTVIGSIEYGVDLLNTPLIVVVGHETCGAVAAAYHTLITGEQADGFVRAVVDRVIPSATQLHNGVMALPTGARELGREHVRNTVDMLYTYSAAIAHAVDAGKTSIVGVEYNLHDGEVRLLDVRGQLDAKVDIER